MGHIDIDRNSTADEAWDAVRQERNKSGEAGNRSQPTDLVENLAAEADGEAGQPPHRCHAEGCDVSVPPKMHMCLPHWRMVPKAVQELIWKHYRRGQENDKRPSIEYIATAFVSVSCVALKEGRPLPTLD